jgi:hypothetical protein
MEALMAYIKRQKTFTVGEDAVPLRSLSQPLDEPVSGTTTGLEVPLDFVSSGRAEERYFGGLAVGPVEASLEISLDGGSSWVDPGDLDPTGGAQGQTESVIVRPVLAPMTGLDSVRATLVVGVEISGDADYAA